MTHSQMVMMERIDVNDCRSKAKNNVSKELNRLINDAIENYWACKNKGNTKKREIFKQEIMALQTAIESLENKGDK